MAARFHYGDEVPFLRAVQGGHVDAPGNGLACQGADLRQGALDTVVNALQQAGAKLYAEGSAGGDDLGAGTEPRGLLIDLDGSLVACHGQDLALQALFTNLDHVGHPGVGQAFGHHQRAGYLNDFSHMFDNSIPIE